MRNYIILAMIRADKKSGIHKKSNKAKRRLDKMKLSNEFYS